MNLFCYICIFCLATFAVCSIINIRLPESYTALQGDLVVKLEPGFEYESGAFNNERKKEIVKTGLSNSLLNDEKQRISNYPINNGAASHKNQFRNDNNHDFFNLKKPAKNVAGKEDFEKIGNNNTFNEKISEILGKKNNLKYKNENNESNHQKSHSNGSYTGQLESHSDGYIKNILIKNDTNNKEYLRINEEKYRKDQTIKISSNRRKFQLSLYSVDHAKPLESFNVSSNISQKTFVFPCGTVVHGGVVYVRLESDEEIISESPRLNVSWPRVVIDVPSRLETYRSPADVRVRFIQSNCLPRKYIFKTWAELLYFGYKKNTNLRQDVPFSVRRKKRILYIDNGDKEDNKWRILGNVNQLNYKNVHFNDNFINKYDNGSGPIPPFYKTSLLTSMQSSTVNARSNTNIPPEALKKWSWDASSQDPTVHVVQQLEFQDELYSKAEHEVRFSCEAVGPAGVYSVRVVTDVASSPIVVASNTFEVAWAEQFTMKVQRSHVVPCLSPIPVTFTAPLCVGSKDRIRLFARNRANVTSSNPPTYLRYITEKRATNHSAFFECHWFTDDAIEFCFFYINRASLGAVSTVGQSCIPTFQLNVLRINGGWGSWTSWSSCSSSCGVGVNVKFRICNNPSPRNGGLFCKGPSVATRTCGDSTCIIPNLKKIASSAISPLVNSSQCQCGCHIFIEKQFWLDIPLSNIPCSKMVTWIFESPNNLFLSLEIKEIKIKDGFEWLKIRDGNSSTSPLLTSLPALINSRSSTNSGIDIRSSSPFLYLSFWKEGNTTTESFPTLTISLTTVDPSDSNILLSTLGWRRHNNLAAIHFVIIILGAVTFIAIAGYSAYYCRKLPQYNKAILVIDDSPLITPTGSPAQTRHSMDNRAGSVATLHEVISMKSLAFGPRKSPGVKWNSSNRKGILKSLPSSPITNVVLMRRGNVSKNRILLGTNAYKRQLNRRSASYDHIPEINLNKSPRSSIRISNTLENMNNDELKSAYIEVEPKLRDNSKEDSPKKYKEYRKSLLNSNSVLSVNSNREEIVRSKMEKEILNREKAGINKLRRGDLNTRSISSVSEISTAEMDLEYDYYDYDVTNASAAPGSLFGMDPTLVPWGIDIDELDIKSPDELTSMKSLNDTLSKNGAKFHHCSLQSVSSSSKSKTDEDIPLEILKTIPPLNLLNELSSTSSENIDDEKTPTAEYAPLQLSQNGDISSAKCSKILNINDIDDIQFADDSENE